MIFTDRISNNINRRKITIISQTPTEIIADIERADNPEVEGTTINANVFNTFQEDINTANSNASNALTLATNASNRVDQLETIEGVLGLVYPIGSIYMSVSETSPASLFGGTWSKLKDQFLLASGDIYTSGSTGGSANHEHSLVNSYAKIVNNNDGTYIKDEPCSPAWEPENKVSGERENLTGGTWQGWGAEVKGLTNEVNNMPPYLVVNMWKRTA